MYGDTFYYLAHHHRTGRPLLGQAGIRLGLAAGLMAELVHGGQITITVGAHIDVVTVNPNAYIPPDAVAHWVFAQIAAERSPRPARQWLAFLGPQALDRVRGRLIERGELSHTPRRLLRPIRYRFTNAFQAETVTAVVLHKLRAQVALSTEDLVMLGLVSATGLRPRIISAASSRDRAEVAVKHLFRTWPAMASLLNETSAAVNSAVLVPR